MHSDDLRTAILLQLESGREYGAWDMLLIAEKAAGELLAAKDTKIAELTRERDLAITHDRQPYPTAWAYEQACKALHERDEEIDRLRSWTGVEEFLDAHYPPSVFDGSSGDEGPQIVALLRAVAERDRRITAAQEQIAAWRGGPMVGMDELLDHLDKFLTSPPGEQGDDHAPQ